MGNKTSNVYFFDKNDGGFIPLNTTIEDPHSGAKVLVKFALNANTGMIDVIEAEFDGGPAVQNITSQMPRKKGWFQFSISVGFGCDF